MQIHSLKRPSPIIFLVALMIVAGALAVPQIIPRAHAATGTVCLTDSALSSSTSTCPTSAQAFSGPTQADITTVGGRSQLRVAVDISGSDGLNGFDIIITADNIKLLPFDADPTGTVLNSIGGTLQILRKCINGLPKVGGSCPSTAGIGTIELATGVQGGNGLTVAPTSGLLFTAIFDIVGDVTTGTIPINFQTGCGTAQNPTSNPPNCVIIENGSAAAVAENILTATYATGGAGTVPFFTMSDSPASITVIDGNSGTSSISVNVGNGFTCGGVPCVDLGTLFATTPGLTATLSVPVVTEGSSVATVTIGTTSGTTPTGTFVVLVVGSADTTSPPTTGNTFLGSAVSITVTVTNFALSSTPPSLTIPAGGSGQATITVTGQGGFTGSVALSATFSPTGSTATFSPTSVSIGSSGSGTSTMTVNVPSTASGTITETVRGASGSPNQLRTLRITITVGSLAATTTTVSCTPSTVANSASTTCKGTVTDTSASPTTPTGTVTFTATFTGTASGTVAGSPCNLTAGTTAGTASCTVTFQAAATGSGQASIVGKYSGDTSHATSTSAAFAVTVGLASTTTSVQCTPGSVTVNTASSCTATVTDTSSSPTTPSGSVSFTTNSTGTFNPTAASCGLAAGTTAGTATCSISYTPTVIGHHQITGSYTGDSAHSPSQGTFLLASTPVALHATTTSITCVPASVNTGTASSCTATVTDTSATPTTPGGSVSFTTNSTGTFNPTSASCTLAAGTSAGTATCSVSYTPIVNGHHQITGTYSGDSTHATSRGSFLIAASPAPPHSTTTTVSCSPASVTINTASTCTATVTDTSATPTTPSGSVSFATNSTGTFNPTTASCNLAPGTAAGTATCSVSYTPTVTGHHQITGSYSGDSTHAITQGTFLLAATPPPPHNTTTSVVCNPSSVQMNTATSCTATVTDSSSSPTTPTGSVSFTTNSTGTFSPSSATCTLAAGATAGIASCPVSYTPTVLGHHSITGSYSGDATHNKSSGSFLLAVSPVPLHQTTTSVQCSPASVTVNTASTCTATVIDTSSSPTTPTGSVSFTSNSTGTFSPIAASCSLIAGATAGTASCPVNYTPTVLGHHMITGSYGGDSTHAISQGSFNLATTPAPPHATSTSVTCSPNSVNTNVASTCTATVTDASSTPTTPSGMVSFTTNSTGTFTPSSAACSLTAGATAGTASCSVSYTPTITGHHLITGNYAGDATHNPSSGTFSLAVSPVPLHSTSTSVQCSPGSVTVNTASTCTATVTDSSTSPTTPTGSVSFTTNSTGTFTPTSASCTLAAGATAGTASCSVTYTPTVLGHHMITGSYGGDATHAISQGSFNLATTPAPQHATSTTVSCSPSSLNTNIASTCTATVTDLSSTPTTPGGSVGFTTNSTGTFTPSSATCTLAPGATAGTSSCSASYTPTVTGHHLITGNYGGDATHTLSSGSFKLAVSPVPLHTTSTSVQCSPGSVTVNTASTCTATVTDTSTSPTTPTGSVSFTTNSTGTFTPTSASCTLAAGTTAGTASCSVSYTPTVSGHHLITGSYSSDATHSTSQGTFNLAATPATLHSTSATVTCSPASLNVNIQTSCTVTVSDTSSSPTTPSGPVSFTTNSTGAFSPTAATCNLAAGTTAGTASCSVGYTPTVAGHHLVTASYPGDSTHSLSSGSFKLAVSPVPLHSTSTSVQCSPGSVTVNTASTCTATVTDSSTSPTTPTGSVSFTTNSTGTFTPTSASCTLTAGATAGTATCSISYTPTVTGHHLIMGSYSSDATHSTSQGTFNLAATSVSPVTHTTQTNINCSPGSVVVNTPTTCTARVIDTSTSPTMPTGSVSFTTNSTGTFNPSATCTLVAGNGPSMAKCTVSYTPTVTGRHMITGSYSGDSSHASSSGSVKVNVRLLAGQKVTLVLSGFDLDDFENGVGQFEVLVNGQLVADIPAGINQLTGSGDYAPYHNVWVNFGPFDITSLVLQGQNRIIIKDPQTSHHFGRVKDLVITQGDTVLLNAPRDRGIYPGFTLTYTFSNPPLVSTGISAAGTTFTEGQQIGFAASYTGGTGPFKCIFIFGDDSSSVVSGVDGTCTTSHAYEYSGNFIARVIIIGSSTSDIARSTLRLTVADE